MALNKVTIQGNLCKDIETQATNNGGLFCRNTIACQRNYVKEGAERQSDFISVLFYGKQCEFLQKYFSKGSQILIEGRIQTGSYDKEDGTKVYTTDVIAEHLYFCGAKKDNEKEPWTPPTANSQMTDLQFEASLNNTVAQEPLPF